MAVTIEGLQSYIKVNISRIIALSRLKISSNFWVFIVMLIKKYLSLERILEPRPPVIFSRKAGGRFLFQIAQSQFYATSCPWISSITRTVSRGRGHSALWSSTAYQIAICAHNAPSGTRTEKYRTGEIR